MNMQMIVFYYLTIGRKDLSNCITDDIITCNKHSLGADFILHLLFYNFPLFLKFSSVLMNMQMR